MVEICQIFRITRPVWTMAKGISFNERSAHLRWTSIKSQQIERGMEKWTRWARSFDLASQQLTSVHVVLIVCSMYVNGSPSAKFGHSVCKLLTLTDQEWHDTLPLYPFHYTKHLLNKVKCVFGCRTKTGVVIFLLFFKIYVGLAISFKWSWRELSIDVAEHRFILQNYWNTHYARFSFTSKTRYGTPYGACCVFPVMLCPLMWNIVSDQHHAQSSWYKCISRVCRRWQICYVKKPARQSSIGWEGNFAAGDASCNSCASCAPSTLDWPAN